MMATNLATLSAALAGRYRIERELGGGGMSRVFLAREIGLDREVVIKVLSADVAAGVSLERFEREIQLAASLQQANIVPLLAAGNADGVPFYAMPFVQGESLRRRLSAPEPLSLPEITGILRDVVRALSYAHERGVVHRDIKPDNVLLSHGAAVVTDFGIAKAVSASRTVSDNDTLTQAGTSLGTPAYMSPEQIAGDPGVDHRADLYAWGCMAYEMLAGEPPFSGPSPQRVLAAHLSETPRPIDARRPDTPPALARLVMRCLAKDPSERPASADEVLRELDAVLTPTGGSSGSRTSRARGAAPWRRMATGTGIVVLLAVALIAVVKRRGSDGAGAVTPADKSIAVLPLANLSGDQADNYFGIGLAEEMTRALAKAGVRVIGRSSAGALQARGLDDRAIARELGVGSLLTGSVQRSGEQVRISVELSAADGTVRWTQAYDRPITNVFAVQDEIARTVARELLGTLDAAAGSLVHAETADPQAHSLLLQGISLWNRRSGTAIRQAIALIDSAVARDPRYARARAWLGMANNTLVFYDDDTTDIYLTRALAADDSALALDSTVTEAWASAGSALMTLGRGAEAARRLDRALALDSTFATNWGWSGILYVRRGEFDDAVRRTRHAVELEPASLISRMQVAQVLNIARRFPAADSAARSVLALDSTFGLAWVEHAEALAGMGRMKEAIDVMEQRASRVAGVRPSEVASVQAWMLAYAGRKAEARAVLQRLRAQHDGRLPPVAAAAAAIEELGDHEAAVALMTEAVAKHDPWLWYSRKFRYDKLRKDPRVATLLAPLEGG